MNQPARFGHFNILPPVVKNLLIINGLFFLGSYVVTDRFGMDVFHLLGLHYWTSDGFRPYQIITHMFMHGSIGHILSNMFALWMFGSVLENIWGGKRFLIYYLITGLGAAIIHNLTKSIDIYMISQTLDPESIALVKEHGYQALLDGKDFVEPGLRALNDAINSPTVGASGAVFGILLAFGMLFPNTLIYLYFAIPIKAKYFVMAYGALELFQGLRNHPGDNIAHFAHLGGMLFGYLLIKYWNKKNRKSFF
ncbi:MAG: rhomboid family intramembrane serine protease [Bacteroidia bacterium]